MLTAEQIETVRSEFAKELSRLRHEFGATKEQCRMLLAIVDTWLDDNAANYNQALPPTVADKFNAKQKLQLLKLCIDARLEVM